MEKIQTCSIEHCSHVVVAKKLCALHYKRMQRTGSANSARPADWGKRESHELYDSWCWMRKMRGQHIIDESWEDNFWAFVSDIGPRPSKQHRIHKLDSNLGYIKGNIVWKEIISTTQDRAKYAREWRKANPHKAKNTYLKTRYGIDLEQYNSMLKKQNCSCAICGKSETEESCDLAVDHCHSNGNIRGLLCKACNKGLGLFSDNPQLLYKAISYLKESEMNKQTSLGEGA